MFLSFVIVVQSKKQYGKRTDKCRNCSNSLTWVVLEPHDPNVQKSSFFVRNPKEVSVFSTVHRTVLSPCTLLLRMSWPCQRCVNVATLLNRWNCIIDCRVYFVGRQVVPPLGSAIPSRFLPEFEFNILLVSGRS